MEFVLFVIKMKLCLVEFFWFKQLSVLVARCLTKELELNCESEGSYELSVQNVPVPLEEWMPLRNICFQIFHLNVLPWLELHRGCQRGRPCTNISEFCRLLQIIVNYHVTILFGFQVLEKMPLCSEAFCTHLKFSCLFVKFFVDAGLVCWLSGDLICFFKSKQQSKKKLCHTKYCS